jgi:Ca-activated chloride channel family protein
MTQTNANRFSALLCLTLSACGPRESYIPPNVGGYPPPSGEHVPAPAGYDAEYAPAEADSEMGHDLGQSLATSQGRAYRSAPARSEQAWNTERYDHVGETGFQRVLEQPLSTFSVDVDTAAYSNVRRFLADGQRPPPDAVRIEELLNYFSYGYEAPRGEHPIAITSELTDSPFDRRRKLWRVGISAHDARAGEHPAKNLVFLIDVSGSMADANKLPLVQEAMSMLARTLHERDRIAIVTYAGDSGVVLPSTPGDETDEIEHALRSLTPGGSTNGGSGIELAYDLAEEGFRPDAVNRVILATDGDFNVGVTDQGSLIRLIEERREQGIFLTVLGFGMGNLNDATMESLADHGNGNYAYIDTRREARKVLVEEAAATLRTVAKDVKLQLEWNPARVARYRLIGYENRRLRDEEFNDDRKDAGDLGDGHKVTALYELELSGTDETSDRAPRVDPLKYQSGRAISAAAQSDELVTIKVRYKRPDAGGSQLLGEAVRGQGSTFERASDDLRFAAAVAGFGMLLRGSSFAGQLDLESVAGIASRAVGRDELGYRREFVELVSRAQEVYER